MTEMDLLVLYFFLAVAISFICSILESVLLSVNMGYISVFEKHKMRLNRRLKNISSETELELFCH